MTTSSLHALSNSMALTRSDKQSPHSSPRLIRRSITPSVNLTVSINQTTNDTYVKVSHRCTPSRDSNYICACYDREFINIFLKKKKMFRSLFAACSNPPHNHKPMHSKYTIPLSIRISKRQASRTKCRQMAANWPIQ